MLLPSSKLMSFQQHVNACFPISSALLWNFVFVNVIGKNGFCLNLQLVSSRAKNWSQIFNRAGTLTAKLELIFLTTALYCLSIVNKVKYLRIFYKIFAFLFYVPFIPISVMDLLSFFFNVSLLASIIEIIQWETSRDD